MKAIKDEVYVPPEILKKDIAALEKKEINL